MKKILSLFGFNSQFMLSNAKSVFDKAVVKFQATIEHADAEIEDATSKITKAKQQKALAESNREAAAKAITNINKLFD